MQEEKVEAYKLAMKPKKAQPREESKREESKGGNRDKSEGKKPIDKSPSKPSSGMSSSKNPNRGSVIGSDFVDLGAISKPDQHMRNA